MYARTGSILVLFKKHELTCNRQTFNKAVRVLYFHYLMYWDTLNKYLNTTFKYIKIKAFINASLSTQMYLNTIVF